MSKSNAVILCRISDQKQDDGYSLDAQERFAVEYCNKKVFNILKIFRFVETGSKSGKRQKFDGMMDFLKNQIDKQKSDDPVRLVVEKPDRLTRNFTNREQIQLFVMMGKLEIHYYKDRRIVDKDCSPADVFTDDMMTSVSKYIALNIARETKKGLNEKARNGWYPGHPPIGYKYVRDGVIGKHGRKEARIVVNPDLKNIVYRMFELRAVNKYSYEAISNEIRTEFTQQLGEKKYKFSKSTVEKTLLHEFYGGIFEWGGVTYQGKHEVFIPPTWVDIAQGKMRGTPNQKSPLGSFSHFLKCALPECGCQIIYDPKTKLNRTKGTERQYHYYHCTDGKGAHKKLGLSQVNANEDKLWAQLEAAVKEISIPSALAADIAFTINENEERRIEEFRQEHRQAKETLETLFKKQDQLYGDMSRGLIDEEDYRRLREKLKEEIQTLRSKLENNYEKTRDLVRERLEITLELAKTVENKWNTSDPHKRLVILRNVLSNLSLDGATIRYDLRSSFKVLAQIKNKGVTKSWCPGPDLNWHARLTEAQDFKSCASTNFATGAL